MLPQSLNLSWHGFARGGSRRVNPAILGAERAGATAWAHLAQPQRDKIQKTIRSPDSFGHLALLVEAIPPRFVKRVLNEIGRLRAEQGEAAANLRAADLTERLAVSKVSLASNDAELRAQAAEEAKGVRDYLADVLSMGTSASLRLALGERVRLALGVIPASLERQDLALDALIARLTDEKWWRRQFRAVVARHVEAIARELGFVHKRAGNYVSDESLTRRRQQKARNSKMLETTLAENEAGQVYTLAELAKLSVSNPKNRYAELMVRARGMEAFAKRHDMQALFMVVTCPSRFHARYETGGRNAKWDNSNPRDGQNYLCTLWARVRADLERAGITYYGLRTVEPHHDGTPHWNFLIFAKPLELSLIRMALRQASLLDSPDDAGAAERRFKCEQVSEEKGGAAAYISKYISKTVDGEYVDTDHESGEPGEVAAERATAWARTWGIRQFQSIGMPPVTVWREVRRTGKATVPAQQSELFPELKAAVEMQLWDRFIELTGGLVKRAKRKVAITWRTHDDQGAPLKNMYGEAIKKVDGWKAFSRRSVTIGIVELAGWVKIATRSGKWVIRRAAQAAGLSFSAGTARPWTRVNNYTSTETVQKPKNEFLTNFLPPPDPWLAAFEGNPT